VTTTADETQVHDIREFFLAYLAAFSTLARGDRDDVEQLLAFYGVPLLVSSDGRCATLVDEAQVLGNVQHGIDAMRRLDYDRSILVSAETTIVNRSMAFHHVHVSRLLRDGSEIERIESTFLITETPAGRRFAAIVLHSPR
jgi:hypothetical protein